MQIRNKVVLTFFTVALMVTAVLSAQRRMAPARPGETDVAVALEVAGQPYQFQGKAVCKHAPVASIYDVMAEMWMVQQSDGQRSLALTLWHPRNGSGDMVSLSVTNGTKSYLVKTVRAAGASPVQGSGKVTFAPSGAGGTFTVDAKASNGAAITGTIKCSAFGQVEAEGG